MCECVCVSVCVVCGVRCVCEEGKGGSDVLALMNFLKLALKNF